MKIPNYMCELLQLIGDAADGMYFVQTGTVSIQLNQETGENVEISVLEKGAYFGELALVTHRPRAATAVALTDVRVACKCLFVDCIIVCL